MRSALVIPFLLGIALWRPAAAGAWTTTVAGTPPDTQPFAVAVDGVGDVVAVGTTAGPGGNEDALLVKLGGTTGAELWRHTFAGSAAANDAAQAVTTDQTDIVAVGQVGQSGSGGDALVAKLDAGGTVLWQVLLDAGGRSEDDALAVVLDGAGNPVVAGQSTPGDAATTRFSVLKRAAADGSSLWRADLAGESGTARAVARLGDDVVAAGDAAGTIVVARLAGADGTTVWRTDVTASTSPAADLGRSVAAGGGRVVVAGRMVSPTTGKDFAVVAFDAATGVEVWRHVVDGSAIGNQDADDAFGVAVDASGDVLAVGRLSDAVTDDDIVLMKLAGASGTELWRTTVNGNNDNDDVAQAIALDATGDLLVTGTIRNRVTRADFIVAAFANATGTERWRQTFDGSEHGADRGFAVAASGTDLVAGGRLRNGTTGDGFVVVKRTGANGGDFPCANGTLDAGEGCDDGNLAAGDGCRADCTVEACGDGIRDPQEACDDGNTTAGDCCSDTCEVEAGACDDGDACTTGETCQGGACVPASTVVCPAEDACHTGVCDHATGACSSVPKAEGAPCDDGNACTVLDRCVASTCSGAVSQVCVDGDPCTADTCDPASGCAFPELEGLASVACLFERDDVAVVCKSSVPRPVQVRLDRARRLVGKASQAAKVGQARRALAKAAAVMQQARRIAAAWHRRLKLGTDCANVLDAALGEIATRAQGVRESLTP